MDYGIYEFKFKVNFLSDSIIYSKTINTFIQIIPSGLAVYALQNGIQQIVIGYAQSLNLNPSNYSFDFDDLAQIQDLSFKFYCPPSNIVDLAAYKTNYSLNQTSCFKSNGMTTFFLI